MMLDFFFLKIHNFLWSNISVLFRWSHTDLLRLREGRVGGQLWTAYAPCGSQHKDAVQVQLIVHRYMHARLIGVLYRNAHLARSILDG